MLWHMRTTLDIDDRLMEALLVRHPGASKRDAVEAAIRFYMASDAADRIRALVGKIEIEDVSKDSRAQDRRV
jgi:Arc/MetJ family transcription regulator